MLLAITQQHAKSAMPALACRHPLAFRLAQLSAITTWSSRRPHGLRARIVTHRPDFLEVAEIFVRHPPAVRYLMNPTGRGTVSLARLSGGAWKLRTVEAALAKVVTLEAKSPELLAPCPGHANASPLTARRSPRAVAHA